MRDILEGLVNEGYVKGLKEDLVGEYTTRLTCKTCRSCSVSHTKDTIATFGTPDGQTNFFDYLKLHSSQAHEFELHGHLNNVEISKSKKTNSCQEYHVRFRTTIDNFPHTLIADIDYVECLRFISIDEFIDLSELAETALTTNAKYQLVVVVEKVDQGRHCLAYVRASKYVNGNPSLAANIDMENMWYKLNDHELELVPFSEIFNAPEHSLLIYTRSHISTRKMKKKKHS